MPNTPGLGLANPASYSITSEGDAVLDNVTGLMWQRSIADGLYAWSSAESYCTTLQLDGHSDWRVPSLIELVSILELGQQYPAIDSTAFPNAIPAQSTTATFWTSSIGSAFVGMIPWEVEFGFGETSDFGQTSDQDLLRCVRTETPPSSTLPTCRYQVASGTVFDTRTGLTWQQAVAPGSYTWADAIAYCPTLGGAWRLPSEKELLTLVDPTTYNAAIDAATFPNTGDAFWSSTALKDSTASAWNVRFYIGNADISLPVTSKASVRCVH